MKTSIQISVVDQHINSADARRFNTLTGLIWSTCLCVYTSGISYQISAIRLVCLHQHLHSRPFVQAHTQKYLLGICKKGFMDTRVVAELELSGQKVT